MESWSHCLKHGTTIEKEKLRQIEAKGKGKITSIQTKEKFVKSTPTPLEPRQSTESWSHAGRKITSNQTKEKEKFRQITVGTPSTKRSHGPTA